MGKFLIIFAMFLFVSALVGNQLAVWIGAFLRKLRTKNKSESKTERRQMTHLPKQQQWQLMKTISAHFLNEGFPDNWDDMSEYRQNQFINEHIHEDYEYLKDGAMLLIITTAYEASLSFIDDLENEKEVELAHGDNGYIDIRKVPQSKVSPEPTRKPIKTPAPQPEPEPTVKPKVKLKTSVNITDYEQLKQALDKVEKELTDEWESSFLDNYKVYADSGKANKEFMADMFNCIEINERKKLDELFQTKINKTLIEAGLGRYFESMFTQYKRTMH